MNRLLTLAIGAVLAATSLSAPVPALAATPNTCPTVAAHRANPKAAPENTVAGINSVPATGAQWVEVDPQDSASGYSVLVHDKTVDRTTNGTGTVTAMALSSLTALNANDYDPWNGANASPVSGSIKVPYAWEYMNAIRANNLYAILDQQGVQTATGAKKMLEYMDRWPGLRSRFVFMGSADEIAAMRAWAGDTLKYTFIEYPAAGTMREAEWLKAQGATAYAIPVKSVTASKAAYYHANDLELWTWTSDAGYETAANRALARAAGVDMMVTNEPALAMAECLPPSSSAGPTASALPSLTADPSPTPTDAEPVLQLPE